MTDEDVPDVPEVKEKFVKRIEKKVEKRVLVKACVDCIYFSSEKRKGVLYLECRESPPIVFDGYGDSYWPIVSADKWCGKGRLE